MSMKKKCILGIGNRLKRDDSAGSILAERLSRKGIFALDCGSTPEAFSGIIKRESPDLLIVVDTTVMGLSPGEFRRIPVDKISIDRPMDTHSLSPAYFLEYVQRFSGELLFIGIEPKAIEFGEDLSPEVSLAVEKLEKIILSGREGEIQEV